MWSRIGSNGPRHALECELEDARLPDARVRAAMAAFYKSNEGYALQQASHTAAYFQRLLGVLDAVLTQPNLSLLEIGAGSAVAMRTFLARHADARAVAMELSPASIRAATHGSVPSLRAVAGNALDLPFRDRSVDAVVAFEVLEHLPDVARALGEMLRVVRRPGFIIIGLPNHASLWTPIEDRLRRRDRRAFGVERGRGAWRWFRRNAGLAWRNAFHLAPEFLYREPILHADRRWRCRRGLLRGANRFDSIFSEPRCDAGDDERQAALRMGRQPSSRRVAGFHRHRMARVIYSADSRGFV